MYTATLLVLAYLGFISLGLPDAVIGVAWPSVRDTFHRPQSAASLIFAGTGLSYFISSALAGKLMTRVGVGGLLAGSSALVAIGATGFALAPAWPVFVACSLLHGLGSGAIDSGLNHFAAHRFPAKHMNWLHGCYSLGAAAGPAIMTFVIVSQGSWRVGYAVVAGILSVLTLLFATTTRRWNLEPSLQDAATPEAPLPASAVLRRPLVWLHLVIFFLYTGLEITIGQWTFTLLTESRGVPDGQAGMLTAAYWGSIVAGRFVLGAFADRIGIDRMLRACLLAVVVGVSVIWTSAGSASTLSGLFLAGCGLAPVFPCLMTRTPQRLGARVSAHAIGMQVGAAMLGSAAWPSLAGALGQAWGLEAIPGMALAMGVGLVAVHEALLQLGARPLP